MRMSGTITLGLLSAVMLTAGCGRSSTTRTVAGGGRVFYDSNRNPVPRGQWVGADGRPKQLFDAAGNPVAENEVLTAYNSTTGTTSSTAGSGYRRSSVWWGPSFYSPSPSYGPWSASGPRPSAPSSAGPGRTYFGGSRPGTSPAPSFGSKSGGSSSVGGSSSSGSVARGGFSSGGSFGGSSAS